MSKVSENKRLPEVALPHVFYEMDMMFRLTLLQQTSPSRTPRSDEERMQMNVRVESFAVHARNLNEFFYPGRHDNEMRAGDFGFVTNQATKLSLTKSSVSRLNAEVCHLGYNRKSKDEPRGWNLTEVAGPLRRPCLDFIQHLRAKGQMAPELDQRAGRLVDTINKVKWPEDSVPIESTVFDKLPKPPISAQRRQWPVVTRGLDITDGGEEIVGPGK